MYSGTSMYNEGEGLEKFVRFNEVSFYGGSFPYILLLLGQKVSFSLYRGLRYIEVRYIEVPL